MVPLSAACDALAVEGIPHLAVLCNANTSSEIISRAFCAGVGDLSHFLFIQPIDALQNPEILTEICYENGLIIYSRQRHLETDGYFGASSNAALHSASELGNHTCSSIENDFVRHLMAKFAVLRLIPHPGKIKSINNPESGSQLIVHLDSVPFIVRPAAEKDIATIHHLQAFMTKAVLRQHIAPKEIRSIIQQKNDLCWVAESDEILIAAVLLSQKQNPKTAAVEVIAIHPLLEEKSEIIFAVLNFVLQYAAAHTEVEDICLGNVRLQGVPNRVSVVRLHHPFFAN